MCMFRLQNIFEERNFSQIFICSVIIFNMLQGLSLSVGTLIMEQLTGIYAELAFLDVALNFGQSLIAFAIFGLDPSLGKLGCWLKRVCRKLHSGKIFTIYGLIINQN